MTNFPIINGNFYKITTPLDCQMTSDRRTSFRTKLLKLEQEVKIHKLQ